MEVLGEKPVGLHSIVELIIVGPWVCIFVPFEGILRTKEPEEGPDLIEDVGLNQRSSKTAVILGVVDQQCRPIRPHGCQVRIIRTDKEICRDLLNVFAAWTFNHRHERRIPSHRNRGHHSLI